VNQLIAVSLFITGFYLLALGWKEIPFSLTAVCYHTVLTYSSKDIELETMSKNYLCFSSKKQNTIKGGKYCEKPN